MKKLGKDFLLSSESVLLFQLERLENHLSGNVQTLGHPIKQFGIVLGWK